MGLLSAPVAAGVPPPRDGVHPVEGAAGARVEAHRNVELGLGAEVCGAGDASADQVVPRPCGRCCAGRGVPGERVVHKEAGIFSVLAARVDARRLGIGEEATCRIRGSTGTRESTSRQPPLSSSNTCFLSAAEAGIRSCMMPGRSQNRRRHIRPSLGKFEDAVGRLRHRMPLLWSAADAMEPILPVSQPVLRRRY